MTGVDVTGSECRIRDGTGSLFSGSELYFNTINVDYNYKNIISVSPNTKIDFNITGAETSIGDEANMIRRKPVITYAGISVTRITISGVLDLDTSGSFADGKIAASLGKLRQMFMTPKTYYFYDPKAGSALEYDSDSDVQNPHSSTSGSIPVILESFAPSKASDTTNEVTFSLTLIEDKQ